MSIEITAFIGFETGDRFHVAFDKLVSRYATLRDATANLLHGEHDAPMELWPYIAFLSASYAFNIYKAIGLILPELYHECGAVLLRQLWEVSLNLHWIEREPEPRAQHFCNYSVMEVRKLMQKSGNLAPLNPFDDATARFQKHFRFRDQRGRNRARGNFATNTVQERAEELGEPWKDEYNLLYHLASMHAHGAPGAVLHQHFVPYSGDPRKKEQDSTGLIAYLAMKILIDDLHLLVRQGLPDSEPADRAFDGAVQCPFSRLHRNRFRLGFRLETASGHQ
jgi:hypothetical protein